jgi:type IV pilus assembly protein PilB
MDELEIEEKFPELFDVSVIQRTGVFPIKQLTPRTVAALMVNPFDYPSQESFESSSDMKVEEVSVAPASLIEDLIDKYYAASKQTEMLKADSGELSGLVDVIGEEYSLDGEGDSDSLEEESAPIISLANRIVEDAYIQGASDIHVEPQEEDLLVRYRIDGVCQEKLRLPKAVAGALVARYKVMSELDIAEKRLPQDGRIVFKKFSKRKIDVDLRVATAPMNFGEKVVMRILDKTKSALPITALGFSQSNLETYRELIRQPYGMILHCGPTGSGKSMTLFSALREIAKPDINIQTAEDPIEYTIPGINQMQMQKKVGLDFARALRSYLRMDPDIILVGEIRDKETAEISVEAALTGHLLLSTLHTNDAPSSVARFTDMGIEPFMISASLLVVCAQRLMRRVCKSCQAEYTPEGNELDVMRRALGGAWGPESIFRAKEGGCIKCGGIGMKGRVGIHELMANSEDLTRGINEGVDTAELKQLAMRNGMKTLHQDAVLKVSEGLTTLLEAVSTVPPDMTLLKS